MAGLNTFAFTSKMGVLLLLVLALVLRLFYFTGISSADDLALANNALRLLDEGPYIPSSHYNARLAMIYPLAGIFALFGTGEWQMALLPLCASLVTIWMAYLIGREIFSPVIGLVAAAILTLFPLDVFLATRFMPDTYFSAFMASAIYLALRAYKAPSGHYAWAFAAGLVWGLGYLIKIEAAFLLFPLAFLAWQERDKWRLSAMIAAGCFVFVGGENIIYFVETGNILHRIQAIGATSAIVWRPEYSATQLWVFPKAWFVTPYLFGVHYYLFFAATIWALVTKSKRAVLVLIWAFSFLIWLQFGFNPFEKTPSFKSHLARYCLNLSVPVAVLSGAFAVWLVERYGRLAKAGFLLASLGSLLLMQFNMLSSEREHASKKALAAIGANLQSPVYMDNGTISIAHYLYRDLPLGRNAKSFQQHNFDTGETRTVRVEDMNGVLVINQEFLRHKQNRYYMQGINVEAAQKHCRAMFSIDNPMPPASYQIARLLRAILMIMPVEAVRQKAMHTMDAVLAKEDVLVFDCRQKQKLHS